MYVSIDRADACRVYLEKGEHDHQLKWPMPEMEIEVRTENKILDRATICTRCGFTAKRLEGRNIQQAINPRPCLPIIGEVIRDFVFLTVKKHLCTGIGLA